MQLNRAISPTDTMMGADYDGYFRQGASALTAIETVIGDLEPGTILDLPCGHGRVARYLAARWPTADLFVSDLDEPGMQFCAETFSATALPSTERFEEIDFGRTFDLIFVGSLITHLSADRTEAFLGFVGRHLSPRGVAVVTSHGEFAAGRMTVGRDTDKSVYGLALQDQADVLHLYFAENYGYRDYPGSTGYGISLVHRDWLTSAVERQGMILESFRGHAWDTHQDVAAMRLA